MKDLNAEIQRNSGWRDQFRDAREHEPVLTWNYAMKGWLRRAEVSILYGPSNCGKSALVCHLGHCIVTGQRFFNARVTRGIVVHVGAEAPDSVLDRMQAYDIHETVAAPYLVKISPVDLSSEAAASEFLAHLREIGDAFGEEIILIVFDTLARSIGLLDENSANEMTSVAKTVEHIARTSNAHVMLVHHTGKDVERGGRGSSALRGAVDTEICLQPTKDGAICVSQDKQRSMPKLSAVHARTETVVLGRDEDGEDRTTVKAVEATGTPDEKPSRNSRNVKDVRLGAVLAALHLRSLQTDLADKPFRTKDIVESLPPEVLEGVRAENRTRTINRVLDDLAKSTSPAVAVASARGEWQLTADHGPQEC